MILFQKKRNALGSGVIIRRVIKFMTNSSWGHVDLTKYMADIAVPTATATGSDTKPNPMAWTGRPGGERLLQDPGHNNGISTLGIWDSGTSGHFGKFKFVHFNKALQKRMQKVKNLKPQKFISTEYHCRCICYNQPFNFTWVVAFAPINLFMVTTKYGTGWSKPVFSEKSSFLKKKDGCEATLDRILCT